MYEVFSLIMSFSSKREFELLLAKVADFAKPQMRLEQYATPASIVSSWLWGMAMRDEIEGRIVLDAGCGPGILGLGCLLLGAKQVYFVDCDPVVVEQARVQYGALCEEYELGEAEFIVGSITQFELPVDVVVQNPPFGTKVKHADKFFLEKAFALAPMVYSLHKFTTSAFVLAIARDYSFEAAVIERFSYPLRAQFAFHTKKIERIDVSLWRFEKK